MAFATNPFLSVQDRQAFRRERRLFLAAISSGTILNPLNSSMISMALHSIQTSFSISFAATSWVISVFYIASAIGQPVMGRLGDLFGKRTIFLIGLLVAALATFSAPFISTFSMLLFLRTIQAIGTSAIFPSGMGLIREHIFYKQAYALAVISVFNSATVAIGPTIGGFAISYGGWPAIFTTNIPFLLVSFLLALFVLPTEQRSKNIKWREAIHHLDLPGVLLFITTIIFLLLFLLSLKSNKNYVFAVLGCFSIVLFTQREYRVKYPFIDLRLFQKQKALLAINIMFVLLNVYNFSLLFGLPTYFQNQYHTDIKMSGLLMLFIAGFGILVSPLAGKWIDSSGVIAPLIVGSAFLVVGAVLVTFFFIRVSLLGAIPMLSIIGIGYGFQNVSLQAAMLRAAPTEKVGIASGLFQTSRYIGAIFASVLLGMIVSGQIKGEHMKILGAALLVIALISTFMSIQLRGLRSK